jgi:hypothetical protein
MREEAKTKNQKPNIGRSRRGKVFPDWERNMDQKCTVFLFKK